jgi:hypothetical protein
MEHEVRIFVTPREKQNGSDYWRIEAVATKHSGSGFSFEEAMEEFQSTLDHDR